MNTAKSAAMLTVKSPSNIVNGILADDFIKHWRPYTRFSRNKLDRNNEIHLQELSDFVNEVFLLPQCLNSNNVPILCSCMYNIYLTEKKIQSIMSRLVEVLMNYYEMDTSSRMFFLVKSVGPYMKSPSIPLKAILRHVENNNHRHASQHNCVCFDSICSEEAMICNNTFRVLFSMNKARVSDLINLAEWIVFGNDHVAPPTNKHCESTYVGVKALFCLKNMGLGSNINYRIQNGSKYRNFVEDCLSMSKKDNLLSFEKGNYNSFLHHFVDHNCPPPSKSYSTQIPCQIFWALISREKNNRTDVFDEDKNLLSYNIRPNVSSLMSTLIPINAGSGSTKHDYKKAKKRFSLLPNERIICNGCDVTEDLHSLQYYRDKYDYPCFVDEFDESKGVFCKTINFPNNQCHKYHSIHYSLVRDHLSKDEVGKVLDVCSRYRHELVLPALIFLIRFKKERQFWNDESEKFQKKKEKIYDSQVGVSIAESIREIEDYVISLGESMKLFISEVSISQMKRFGWGKWPLILEDADEFFDDSARLKRIDTRDLLPEEYKNNPQKLKDLHLLHASRIMLFSQQS